MRRYLVFVWMLVSISGAPAQESRNSVPAPDSAAAGTTGQADVDGGTIEETLPPLPPVVATSCKLNEPSKFLVEQEGQKPLLRLSFKRCNLSIDSNDVVTAFVDVELALDRQAPLAKCNSFQIGLLFEGAITHEKVKWPGVRTQINGVPLESLLGDRKDLNHFPLHTSASGTEILLGPLLREKLAAPGYPELYWGTAQVLKEDRTGSLAQAVDAALPKANVDPAKPDLSIVMDLQAFTPTGWCIYRDPNDVNPKRADLIAKPQS